MAPATGEHGRSAGADVKNLPGERAGGRNPDQAALTSSSSARRRALVARALVAIALTIGFYIVAIAVAAGLIAFPVLRVEAGESPGLLGLATSIVALCILVSLVPQRQRFEAPGPPVTRDDQPELLALVEDVADAVGYPVPDATYLDADVNAGVFEVGRAVVSRRRVLVIGLPLLELLTVEQLRAVLAHEFGHYIAGDTRIGLWTYRTREAIVRTVSSLHWDAEGNDGWLLSLVRKPFELYADLFMRITSAISRNQEYAADRVAVEIAGREAHVGALRRTAAGGPAFDAFWHDELVPALMAGVRLPLGEGFRRFLTADRIDHAVAEVLNDVLEQDPDDPYDSHPTLRQRLAVLGAPADEDPPAAGPPATALLRDHSALEDRLLRVLGGDDAVDELRTARWDDISAVWLEHHTRTVSAMAAVLDGRTLGDVPALVADPTHLAADMRAAAPEAVPDHKTALDLARHVLGAATVVGLVADGFALHANLGEPLTCERGEHRFTPFVDLTRIEAGTEQPAALAERFAAAGLSHVPLAPSSESSPPDAASRVRPL